MTKGARARLLATIPLAFTGCTPADERCRTINSQQNSHDLRESAEARFHRKLSDSLPPGAFDAQVYEGTKRRLRAQAAAELRAFERERYPNDSAIWIREDPATDSQDPTPTPPPRPSEIAWYAENCYDGEAR